MSAEVIAPKYPIFDDLEVPEKIIENWQTTVDILAQITKTAAALIMRVHAGEIEVFVSSHSPGNVYHRGEKAPLNSDLYCEKVMDTQHELLVPNALKDPLWEKNPDIALGMIFYCGLPLTWPGGKLFGTICILDHQENTYSRLIRDLLMRFRDSVQLSLESIYNASVERKKAAKEVAESQSLLQDVIDNSNSLIYACDPQGRFMLINRSLASLFGVPRESLIGKTREAIMPPEIAAAHRDNDLKVIDALKPIALEEENITPDGIHTYLSVKFPIIDPHGNVQSVGVISTDITERKHAENALHRAHKELELKVEERTSELSKLLKEKEILLKEIHHRVKNNLQIVSSMLQLQSTYMKDEQAIMAFREGRNRVETMALIHEKIYRSKDLERINFAEYIEELVKSMFSFYGINIEHIKPKINMTDVFFDINTVIPCGLIINELVSNSLKHAFPEGRSGEINIKLQSVKDKFVLVVSDNGVGFPVDLDFRNTETLGMRLVISLINQLDGVIELDRSAGTRFEITFSELKYKERR